MVNSNPETVSTDYDTSSRLYFEPLSAEDVLAVCGPSAGRRDRAVRWSDAARLARTLQEEGYTSWGPGPEAIDLAEDRGKFARGAARTRDPAPAAR